MLFGFIFSYLEIFFVVFSLSFYFILALRIGARDTQAKGSVTSAGGNLD